MVLFTRPPPAPQRRSMNRLLRPCRMLLLTDDPFRRLSPSASLWRTTGAQMRQVVRVNHPSRKGRARDGWRAFRSCSLRGIAPHCGRTLTLTLTLALTLTRIASYSTPCTRMVLWSHGVWYDPPTLPNLGSKFLGSCCGSGLGLGLGLVKSAAILLWIRVRVRVVDQLYAYSPPCLAPSSALHAACGMTGISP